MNYTFALKTLLVASIFLLFHGDVQAKTAFPEIDSNYEIQPPPGGNDPITPIGRKKRKGPPRRINFP